MIDFPDSPEVDDVFTEGTRQWRWTGAVWDLVSQAGPAGPVGPQGATGATGPTGPSAVVNTDDDPGTTIFVGATDPADENTVAVGDVWIRPI